MEASIAAHAAPVVTEQASRRVDLYADIHKALRACMTKTLVDIGSTDHEDADDVAHAMSHVRELLDMCRAHLKKENQFVHPAVETRAAGASHRIADEHDEHLQAIADLEEDVGVVIATRGFARETAIARLYQHLALFVTENFEHMHVEETVHNPALWAHYSDEELLAIHHSILAAIPPEETMAVARWMVPAITPATRAAMFRGMRMGMPAPAFDAMLQIARTQLDNRTWGKLARDLGME